MFNLILNLLELILNIFIDVILPLIDFTSLQIVIAEDVPICTPDGVCKVPTKLTSLKEIVELKPVNTTVTDDKTLTRKILEACFTGFSIFAVYLIYTCLTEGRDKPPAGIGSSVDTNPTPPTSTATGVQTTNFNSTEVVPTTESPSMEIKDDMLSEGASGTLPTVNLEDPNTLANLTPEQRLMAKVDGVSAYDSDSGFDSFSDSDSGSDVD